MRKSGPPRVQRAVLFARAYPGRTMLVLLAAGVGLYLLKAHLLPSDTREVRAAIAQVRSGILDGDADAVLDRVAPEFYQDGLDKSALAAYLRRVLPRRPVERLDVTLRQLRVRDGAATALVRTRLLYEGHHLPSDWDLSLVKVGGRWMLLHAEPVPIDGLPAPGLQDLTHMY
jgi:hypothetical protein